MDEERARHIETEILALRMMIQTMLILLTDSNAEKAYDEALFKRCVAHSSGSRARRSSSAGAMSRCGAPSLNAVSLTC